MDDLLRLVSRRRWLILVILLISTVIGAAYSWLSTPVWRADALIRIQETTIGPTAALFPDMVPESQVETEMMVVKTRPILGRAVEALGLSLVLSEPKDLPREYLFSEISVRRDAEKAEYTLERAGPNSYAVTEELGSDSVFHYEISAGHRIPIPGGYVSLATDSAISSHRDFSPPDRIRFKVLPFDQAVENLEGALTVERPDRNARVFRISYDAHDRRLARDVIHEVTQAFIAQGRDLEKSEARATVAFLEEQSAQIKTQLEGAEEEFQRFREGQQVVAIESQAEEQVRRLADLQTNRAALAAERDALSNLFDNIRNSDTGSPDFTRLVAFPSFQQVDAIQALAQSLVDAETRRTDLRARWTEDHPGVVALDQQIDQLKGRLEDIGRNYLQSLNDQIASLDSVLADFGRDLGRVPARELQYARLERQAVLLADLYSTLEQRLKEAEVRAAVEDQGVLVAEPPVLPREPIHPRPVRYMALSLVLGSMLGLGAAFLRQQLDHVLRREDDVGELLGLSVLSQVPRLEGPKDQGGALVAVGRGPSFPAEAFRTLRTSVFFATRNSEASREILITSPGAREGKSTTACNVAITSAQQGLNTLLVDCDLRRGNLNRVFKIGDAPGLSDFLMGNLSPGELIRSTAFSRLSLVPAGKHVTNPSELLGSADFDRFLESARKTFEVILVDSPPVLAVTDAIVLATKVKGVVLVVRMDRTHREAASDALSQLKAVGAGVLGVVINDTPETGRYGYRSSYYRDYFGEEMEEVDFAEELT